MYVLNNEIEKLKFHILPNQKTFEHKYKHPIHQLEIYSIAKITLKNYISILKMAQATTISIVSFEVIF